MPRTLALALAISSLLLLALVSTAFMMGGMMGMGGMGGMGGMRGMHGGGSSPSGQPVSGTTDVVMKDIAFKPANLQVPLGSTVTWTNQDSVPHDVRSKSGEPEVLRSDLLQQGDTYSYTFNQPGTYEYYCSVHPQMTAQIVVK